MDDVFSAEEELRARVAARLFQARREPPPIPPGFPPHLVYLRPLASGAAGEVHLASDPALDRAVAVKLLRSRGDPADLRRLHREARTLARLAHPHVVHVYEVGEHAGHLFLVMEYVDGGSLLERQRAGDGGFGLAAIVTAYTEAAEGLAAAHAAGIVHRDVKPANLLLGTDGRVRVADFGLAHPVDESTDPRTRAPDDALRGRLAEQGEDAGDVAVALVGPLPPLATESRLARGGTPAYMAPETLRDGIADARSDQFSWGVSFFEAIYGRRLEIRRGVQPQGGRAPPRRLILARAATGERVPAYVRDVLARALTPDPSARATTFAPLIAALRGGPSRSRRRRAAGLAALLTVVAGTGAYAIARSRAACPSPDGLLDGTWDAAIAARVESQLSSSPQPFAAAATAYAIDAIDDYGRRWRLARVEACELTRTRAERSDTFLELANACLDARRAHLVALVEQLSGDSPDVLASVSDLVGTLAPIEVCTNPSALEEGRDVAFDPRLAARLAEIRDTLARARLAFARGLQVEALRLVDGATDDARRTAAPLVVADALLTEGLFLRELADGSRARAVLLEALDAAETADAPSVKAEILIALALTDAELNERLEPSSYHLERARATLARLSVDPERHVPWLVAKAGRDALAGDAAAAVDSLNSAIAALGEDAPVEAATLLGAVARHLEAEQPAEARIHYERAQALLAGLLGVDHPRTVKIGFNLGLLDQHEGHLDRAAAAFERMRASVTAAQGVDAPLLATVHSALADLANVRGEPERALAEAARALAIEATLPFEEPTVVAAAHTAMSNAERLLGNTDRALEHTLAAFEIQRSRLGPRDLVEYQINLGEFLCAPGGGGEARRCGEARSYYAAAADTVRSATDLRGRTEFAYAMNGLGKVGLHARAYAEAASAYLVAQQIGMRELAGADALLDAEVHWGLAQARAGLGSPVEADAHAQAARAACLAAGYDVARDSLDGTFTPTICIPRGGAE